VPGGGRQVAVARGLQALREAVACALLGFEEPQLALVLTESGRRTPAAAPHPLGWLLSETVASGLSGDETGNPGQGFGDGDLADAFGMLYDHYQGSVFRFLFYRTRSSTLAEDLTSETFFRALRNMQNFRWQGKDFGAWLMTIARNLATDHFKAGRTRLEMATEDMGVHDDATEGPEQAVLASLTNEILLKALTELPSEQKDCLIMRFLQGMSIAETAGVLGRSEGAVKQLQLRGVRNLAKLMPEGIR
jgi:RNA polymerase sigma-70 factor, ECF subfamily